MGLLYDSFLALRASHPPANSTGFADRIPRRPSALKDIAPVRMLMAFGVHKGAERDDLYALGAGVLDQPRCERSWKRDGTVKQRSDGGMLSDRDAEALGLSD